MVRYDESLIVPSRAERERALVAWLAWGDACEDVERVRTRLVDSKYDALFAKNDADVRDKKISRTEYYERRKALFNQLDNEADFANAVSIEDKLSAAIQPNMTVATDSNEDPVRCALSSVVILASDDVLECGDEAVLRCLILGRKASDREAAE